MTRISTYRTVLVVGFISVATVLAQSYEITNWTVDGGGGMSSTGGGFELNGTIGQPDANSEVLTGGDLKLRGGFWPGQPCPLDIPADYDTDCDVDQSDYAFFEDCASGPSIPYTGGCSDADLDADGDVDQNDFSVFQRCLSGEDNPGDPNCAE